PAGIIAFYLKHRHGLKTLLTEHWTVFYKERKYDYIGNQSFIKKLLYREILQSFDVIISVANRLQDAIQEWSSNSRNYVIPKVVNTKYFNFNNISNKEKADDFRFFHASTLGYQKNIDGILRVFEKLISNGLKITLTIAGAGNKKFAQTIKRSQILSKHVIYVGELSNEGVSAEMKKAD